MSSLKKKKKEKKNNVDVIITGECPYSRLSPSLVMPTLI